MRDTPIEIIENEVLRKLLKEAHIILHKCLVVLKKTENGYVLIDEINKYLLNE